MALNKKGDAFQVLFMLILLFAVAVVGLLMLVLTMRVNQEWDRNQLMNQTAPVAVSVIDDIQDTAPKTTDYAVFLLFLGMNIGIIIAAVRTNFSAAVIFLFILLILISIMMAAGMVNMYQGLAQQPSILDVSSTQTLTNFLFSRYLPLIISIISAGIMLIMWGKSGGDIVA